jgi:hypothetical protein
MIMTVQLEVLREIRDPLGEHRNLNFGAASVSGARAVLGDDLCLYGGFEGHVSSFRARGAMTGWS